MTITGQRAMGCHSSRRRRLRSRVAESSNAAEDRFFVEKDGRGSALGDGDTTAITDPAYFTEEEDEDDDADDENHNFDEAVALFNGGEYYECHDYLEALWHNAEDPARTLIHGILQCAVGFHHLFNQNHKGAMMELGEGLCKLRKMEFSNGPFHKLEKEISAVLDFIYQTQIELAACSEDICVATDQSERSYQLMGEYAAEQRVYDLELGPDASVYIVFCPQGTYGATEPPRAKIPRLKATSEHLVAYEYK